MRTKTSLLIVAVVMLTGLGACYSSPDVTLHSPGVYKGPIDPLLAKERNPEHQTALRERFNLVQRDR